MSLVNLTAAPLGAPQHTFLVNGAETDLERRPNS
jgi:hypothetical protein